MVAIAIAVPSNDIEILIDGAFEVKEIVSLLIVPLN